LQSVDIGQKIGFCFGADAGGDGEAASKNQGVRVDRRGTDLLCVSRIGRRLWEGELDRNHDVGAADGMTINRQRPHLEQL
jgi:hypothetical protein